MHDHGDDGVLHSQRWYSLPLDPLLLLEYAHPFRQETRPAHARYLRACAAASWLLMGQSLEPTVSAHLRKIVILEGLHGFDVKIASDRASEHRDRCVNVLKTKRIST